MTANELTEVVKQCKAIIANELDGKGQDVTTFNGRLDALERRIRTNAGVGEMEAMPGLGTGFLESAQFKSFMATGQPGKCRWEIQTKDFVSGTNLPIPPQRLGTVGFTSVGGRMRSILPTLPVTSGSVAYLRAKTKTVTGSITQVAQGDVKAKASWIYEEVKADIITSAETARASRQALEDLPELQGQIDGELTSQVLLNEENEIINGAGGTGHMTGFLTVAPLFTATVVAGQTILDVIAKAIGQLEAAGYRVTATVLSAIDWLTISLLKDSAGKYVISNPGQGATPLYLWNRPAVVSPKLAPGKFLTGAFETHSMLLDRSRGVELDTALTNVDDFETNMVTLRAELRSGLMITRPEAFLQGSMTLPV